MTTVVLQDYDGLGPPPRERTVINTGRSIAERAKI
jgi:hypothetical protein